MSNQLKIEKITPNKIYEINKMGTSGLRQTQEVYNQKFFLEQFTQGLSDFFLEQSKDKTIAKNNKTLVIGGDPRRGNQSRIKTIASILAANGFKVLLAKNGLASTPSMSHAIRHFECLGAIILTASHNPYTDVGIKINAADGSPALDAATSRVHVLQNKVKEYQICNYEEAEKLLSIEHFDVIKLYADLLDSILNFSEMKKKIKEKNIKAAFDSMHGAAGPFAREVFVNRLEMDAKLIREEPREDLGGHDENGHPLHPEPDFDFIADLISLNKESIYDIVAAWDSDVDRRLDGGNNFFLESADEFALFAMYSELVNIKTLFPEKLFFCRSTVTADTIDRMEDALKEKFGKIQTLQTPTGFKWIAELGNWGVEESNGVGNPYIREKDGIFATAFLLKIMLHTNKTSKQLMEELWTKFGRVYFTRGEVSGSKIEDKMKLEQILKNAVSSVGQTFAGLKLLSAEQWDYIHPLSGKLSAKAAAYVLNFSDGNTLKARFSGTGSGGYTLRVYCSKYDKNFSIEKSKITQPMKDAFDSFLSTGGFSEKSKKYTDANQPDPYKESK